MLKLFLSSALALAVFSLVSGHGRLLDPPGRSSLWRFADEDDMLKPYKGKIVPNYSDNQLFCGGFSVQHRANKGKCGVCGDDYSAKVKDNEAGGKYALGIITRIYTRGQILTALVQITAFHKGYMEFRLCPNNDVKKRVTQECLDRHLLQLVEPEGETKFFFPEGTSYSGEFSIDLKLPDDVTCSQCVLQWRYHTGNSWGTDQTGSGIGKGPQEEFYACADVAIVDPRSCPDPPCPESSSTVTTRSTTPLARSTTPLTRSTTPLTRSTEAQRPPLPPTKTTTTSAETTVTTKSSSLEPVIMTSCTADQNFKFLWRSCTSFYRCVYGRPHTFECPQGTFLDPKTIRCVHKRDVPECFHHT